MYTPTFEDIEKSLYENSGILIEEEKGILEALVRYEVGSSWWAGYISNKYLQDLAVKYFAKKVSRKWNKLNKTIKLKKPYEFTRFL